MSEKRREINPAEIENQRRICREIFARNAQKSTSPLACVDTYGCQQNEADSEILRGFLRDMGYGFTENEYEADLILVNTCAVREHAEMRILGNVGALNHTKKAKPGQIIVLCGCMAQQAHMPGRIKKSFPIVDLVFGPFDLWRFPELLLERLDGGKRVFAKSGGEGVLAEDLPTARQSPCKAWLSIMYGCDNFCSYCVVPHVRGRERSRGKPQILADARALVADGVKDITLLGQNVNSYGKDLGAGETFPALLREISAVPGDFLIRFITSHPKDAGEELFRAMAESEKCARHLHLPVQAGNDRVLRAMNRGYTAAEYLEKIRRLRELMPDLVLTTDIIVGFPGETEAEFEDTLRLVAEARFDAMFTFLYSKRPGTPAANLPDPASRAEKQQRFDRLLALANGISAEKHAAYIGKTLRVLVDGDGAGRTNGGRLVRFTGDAAVGEFAEVKITGSTTWSLEGETV
ncbi:MAG: tRNA (N6-isopentenyl adenosine(37)-C2)-methylthiotransferase MiaB [Firmicutes bacterium]|nr:tRNA (N6-isopentenyl adenosine(37)-C2)-methylthiotransferase MiaB [Bacillota bacterium]